ncbi:MAG TPA: ATP-binding cassette domain-containing protein, partial [Brachybacterium faecium]|nr:ATP-binding cassette domain-containing protein [Brachybacterium faecium]
MPENTAGPGAGDAPHIEFRDVVKRFGDNTVLDNLNFTVSHGERVTLIGPSGSGKTTILRLVMTLEELTDGYIYVGGTPLQYEQQGGKRARIPDKRRRRTTTDIGMVFQHFNLFPNMTVLENVIEAPIHVMGLSKDEAVAKAEALLDQVGMAWKKDARPSELSGGYIHVGGVPLQYEEKGGKRVRIPDKRRRRTTTDIGMVFQHFNLFPNMTVLENIVEAPIHVKGLSRADAVSKAEGLLAKVGMGEKRDMKPSQLSGGQQQR